MLLGICTNLSNEFSVYIMRVMEPLAGRLWGSVGETKQITDNHPRLGGMVLRMCESIGRNASSRRIFSTISGSGSNNDCSTSLANKAMYTNNR